MEGKREARAGDPAGLAALEALVRDMGFPVAEVRHDPLARTVAFPFERVHPRREAWILVVHGAGAPAVEGTGPHGREYFRSLRWDAKARVLEVRGVLLRWRIPADGIAVDALRRTGDAPPGVLDADQPAWFRREVDDRLSEQHRRHERFERSSRGREASLAGAGAVVATAFGACFANPWWALLLNALSGGAAGFWIARKGVDFHALGALAFGLPGMLLSCTGGLFAEMTGGSGMTGLVVFPLWVFHAVTGVLLVRVHEALVVRSEQEVEGMVPGTGEVPLPAPRPGLWWKAAAAVGGASALLFGILSAPLGIAFVAVPLVLGGATAAVARLRPLPGTGGAALAGTATVLGAAACGAGGMLLPSVLLLAVLHFGAGVLVVFHARGEGPPP
jgi:hypothetical protein